MARTKTLGDLVKKAKREIRAESTLVLDYCANTGQMLRNVKHMRWLVVAIAEEIIKEYPEYSHLKLEKEKDA